MSYWTFALHRGQGYATRALRLGAAFAYEEMGINRVELEIEPDNYPSRRVAQRAGFVEQDAIRQKEENDRFVLERHASQTVS